MAARPASSRRPSFRPPPRAAPTWRSTVRSRRLASEQRRPLVTAVAARTGSSRSRQARARSAATVVILVLDVVGDVRSPTRTASSSSRRSSRGAPARARGRGLLTTGQHVVCLEGGSELVPVGGHGVGELVAVAVGDDHAGPEGLAELDHVLAEGGRGDRLAAESPDRLPQLDRGEAPPRVERQEDDDLEQGPAVTGRLVPSTSSQPRSLTTMPWRPGGTTSACMARAAAGDERRGPGEDDPALTIGPVEGSTASGETQSCSCRHRGPRARRVRPRGWPATGCHRRLCQRPVLSEAGSPASPAVPRPRRCGNGAGRVATKAIASELKVQVVKSPRSVADDLGEAAICEGGRGHGSRAPGSTSCASTP